jgi:hypothetical protein
MLYNLTPVATVNIQDEATIEIHRTVEDTFLLKWNDGVANEWSENYSLLSSALARAATLAACGETGWGKGFSTVDPQLFANKAEAFISQEIL